MVLLESASDDLKYTFTIANRGRSIMKGDPKVFKVLSDVLRKELTGTNQYFVHAKMCKNWGYEVLAGVHRIVLLGHRTRDVQHAQSDHLQALALKARQDLPDQSALYAIGLDQDQGAFHVGVGLLVVSQARAARSNAAAASSSRPSARRRSP